MRKIKLPSGKEIILSDTVGFISDLPHELVMAFRATLEEVLTADLVVHVRDVASENSKEQAKDVYGVLESLGFDDFSNSTRYIEVLNKTDLLDKDKKEMVIHSLKPNSVAVSAITGEGCDKLLELVDDVLSIGFEVIEVKVDVKDGKKIAWIHSNSEVLDSKLVDDMIELKIKISKANSGRLEQMS